MALNLMISDDFDTMYIDNIVVNRHTEKYFESKAPYIVRMQVYNGQLLEDLFGSRLYRRIYDYREAVVDDFGKLRSVDDGMQFYYDDDEEMMENEDGY